MNNRLLIIGLLLISSAPLWAQPTVTLLTFESYTFDEKFNLEYGSGKVFGGFQWGGGFEIGMNDMAVELIYQRLSTHGYYDDYNGFTTQQKSGDIGINYIMLGGTRYAPLNDKISGFGTVDVGAMFTSPSDELQTDAVTKFALGLRLGVRIKTSEKVSLRLHTQIFSPVQGGGFYIGTGGAGVTTGSTIFQFNLGGSLNFKLR